MFSREVEKDILNCLDRIDWYRRCLEGIQDRQVVRGLAEAKAGYDSAMNELSEILELETPFYG